jgi:hypothetical protein
MSLTYRELRPEEFVKAPREVPGSEIFTPANSRILAAIDEKGDVVATWTFFLCAHIEPVWVREDHRHSMRILARMSNAMKTMLRAMGVMEVYTVVLDKTPVLHKFAVWFGAKPIDGTLYNWKDDQHAPL